MAPWISLALMVLAGLGLVLRHDLLPVIGFDLGIASAAVAIAGLLMFSGRDDSTSEDPNRRSMNWHQPMITATLALIVFAGYTFSNQVLELVSPSQSGLKPIAAERKPTKPTGRVALSLKRQSNGLFSARGRVNGSPTELTIDTGATTVVLSAEDARRAGINLADLAYTVPVQTGNGTVYAAPAQLERIFVGPLGAADVEALIAKPGRLEFSLLGMSFLKRLRSYRVQGNHMTLEG